MKYQKVIPGLILTAIAPSVISAQVSEDEKVLSKDEVLNYTKKIVSEELGIFINKVVATSHLHNDLGMDSLEVTSRGCV